MHYSWKMLEWHTVDAVMNLSNCALVPCRGLIAYTMYSNWGPTGVKWRQVLYFEARLYTHPELQYILCIPNLW